jgi:predicted alpha/beta hydrolase family esterase
MKTAIIVHGMSSKEEYYKESNPSFSNDHWLPWIQRQLLLHDVLAQAPEFPKPYEPEYSQWCSVFEQFHINEDTILIGHSLGAGFLVRWLSETKQRVGTVVLVAPFLDPDHDEVKSDFFNFQINSELRSRTKGLHVFVSSDDDQEILTSVDQLKSTILNIQIHQFTGRGHFTIDSMKTVQFPELGAVVCRG